MAIIDLRNSFGANGDTNRTTLASAHSAASSGDEIWLPATGWYPLKLDATTGRILLVTKPLKFKGLNTSPGAAGFIIQTPASISTQFANTITFDRNVGNCEWHLFGLDSEYATTTNSLAQTVGLQGLTFLLGSGHQCVAPYIRNFVSHMLSMQGATCDVWYPDLSTTDTSYNPNGGNHGLDCDEDPATNGAHLVRVYQGSITNKIGHALKSEKGKVELYGVELNGAIAFGNNDSGDTTPFGNHVIQGCTINGILSIADTASSPGTCTGPYAYIRGNSFGVDGLINIGGGANSTYSARYANGGANAPTIEGNVFAGLNSIVEHLTGAAPTAVGGEVHRDTTLPSRNIGMRPVLHRFVRSTAIGTYEFTGAASGEMHTPRSGNTSTAVVQTALNATDVGVWSPGTYTTANAGAFTTLTPARKWIAQHNADGSVGVIFDGRSLGDVARAFAISPTTGTLQIVGRLRIINVASTTTFAGGIDVNPTSPAIVDLDEVEFDNIYRDGAAFYAAALRSRGTGAFGFNRLVASNCKDGNTTNGGDGMCFAFEHTGGWIAGKPLHLHITNFTERGTDARSGIVSNKTGSATVISSLYGADITFAGVTAALFYSTVPTAQGCTIRQLTCRNVTGAASSKNCLKAANGATITVTNYAVDSASRGNDALAASGAIDFGAYGIYEGGGQSESRVTYHASMLTASPSLGSNGRPQSGSPCIDAGTRWWTGWLTDASNEPLKGTGASLGALRPTTADSAWVGR